MNQLFKGLLATGLVAFLGGSVKAEVRIQGTGATFPAPIYQRWGAEYSKVHPDVKIDFQGIGSGGGIKGITEKTVDFGASDAPMSKKEIEAAGDVVQVPMVAGPVVVAYNLEGVANLKLDGATIADIFLAKITSWNDPKIAALNPGVTLPSQQITTVHRTDGSGTTYVFTNYVATQSDDFKEKVGMGKQVEWPNGQGGKGSDGVTQIVVGTKGAIGYIELNYAKNNKLGMASVKNKEGNFVAPTPDGVAAAGAAAVGQMTADNLVVNIWNQGGKDSYPISAFTYILIHKDLGYFNDAAKARTLVDFLTWSATEGQAMAPGMDYAPLAPEVQKKVTALLGTIKK